MIIINGIDKKCKNTCHNSFRGESVVDYIIMHERMIKNINGEEYKTANNNINIMLEFKSMCEIIIKEAKKEAKVKNQEDQLESSEGEMKEKKRGWKRRDNGDRKFWDRLKVASNEIMGEWSHTVKIENKVNNVEEYIENTLGKYQECLDEALIKGVGKTKNRKKNNKCDKIV